VNVGEEETETDKVFVPVGGEKEPETVEVFVCV
jgi:hypothetical protein